MSGFVGLNTSDIPRGSGVITQVVWGAPGPRRFHRPPRARAGHKGPYPYRALRCPPERRVMRARYQPMRDRLNPCAVFLLTARSPWLAGRSQAQHMPEPAILLGSHPWPPTPRTSVPDRWQPEASIRRAS
jgi:hypothetical protein